MAQTDHARSQFGFFSKRVEAQIKEIGGKIEKKKTEVRILTARMGSEIHFFPPAWRDPRVNAAAE